MVRTHNGGTEWFKVNKGVRHDYILSTFFFNLFGEQIMRRAELEAQVSE